MNPNPIIRALDQALQRTGQDVSLRRVGQDDLAVRARVRDYTVSELAGAIQQGDSHVIMSPTEMTAANWPAPPKKGDRLLVGARVCLVETVAPKHVDGEAVRYELVVRG